MTYRVVALSIDSTLQLGTKHQVEICEDQWLYYSYNYLEDLSREDTSQVRRLATYRNSGGRDLLASTSTHGADAIHLSVKVWFIISREK